MQNEFVTRITFITYGKDSICGIPIEKIRAAWLKDHPGEKIEDFKAYSFDGTRDQSDRFLRWMAGTFPHAAVSVKTWKGEEAVQDTLH